MASIEKEDGGGYRVRWRNRAGKQRCRNCNDHETAKKLKRKIENAIALGEDWDPASPAPTTPTLEVITQAFLDDQARLLAAGTLRNQHSAINMFVAWLQDQYGENLDPKVLSRQTSASFHTYLTSVRECSQLTANARIRLIEDLWEWAEEHDDYEKWVPRRKRLRLPDAQPRLRTVAPTWMEMDSVIAAAKGWYVNFLTVLRYTGLRKSQVMRLRWEDIDMEAGTLYVRPELGKSKREQIGRTVLLSPHLLAEIAGWGRREGWLVPCARANRDPDEDKTRRIWIRAGITTPEILRQPHHAFRKGLVSNLRAAGADMDAVKFLVGHKLDVTGETYSDPKFALGLKDAIERAPAIGASGVLPMPVRVRESKLQGSAHPLSRLTVEDVLEIRRRCAAGEACIDLAPEYSVSVTTISLIARRKTWKHLPEEPAEEMCIPCVPGKIVPLKAIG
jgi:integrase